jgi:hypothetical protein
MALMTSEKVPSPPATTITSYFPQARERIEGRTLKYPAMDVCSRISAGSFNAASFGHSQVAKPDW